MAISRHSAKWKRMIFMAMAAGVRFSHLVLIEHGGRRPPRHCDEWVAEIDGMRFRSSSKYSAARDALDYIEGRVEILPDAANETKTATGGSGPELRSST